MNVVKIKQTPQSADSRFKADPNLYGLYDENGGSPLGIVKSNFQIMQPQDVVNGVMDCLKGINGIDTSKMQYHTMRDGAKHRLSLPVYEYNFKNAKQVNDITQVNLDITWGYTGRDPFLLRLFARRLWCLNGCTSDMKGVSIKFKSFKDNAKRLKFACDQFTEVIQMADGMKLTAETFNSLVVTEAERAAIISKVMNTDAKATAQMLKTGLLPEGDKRISEPKQQTLLTLIDSIRTEEDYAGQTAWGLFNGFTRFTNHHAPNVTKNTTSEIDDRIDYLLNGGGADINSKANKAISELVSIA